MTKRHTTPLHRYLTPIAYITLCLTLFPAHATALDITPLSGSQGGGKLSHISTGSTLSMESTSLSGIIIGWPISHFQDMEIYYSQQLTQLEEGDVAVPSTDLIRLSVNTLHMGGTVLSENDASLRGFLSGGVGFTQYSPSLSGAEAEIRPSMSFGLGARWMPSERVGVRIEARILGTLFNSNASIFCSGGCNFSISGDLLTQYALFAGVVVRLD